MTLTHSENKTEYNLLPGSKPGGKKGHSVFRSFPHHHNH